MNKNLDISLETYKDLYEEDIMELIDAIKSVIPYTKWGADVKSDLLNILYYDV